MKHIMNRRYAAICMAVILGLVACAPTQDKGRRRNHNADLVTGGYARADRRYKYELKTQFIELEAAARRARRGLWGACPA